MIDPKIINETRLVIGPCRLSYVHLFERWNPDNALDGGKYCVTPLIPKTEMKTINAIMKAMEAAKKQGALSKWRGKSGARVELALRDGDQKEGAGDEYAGHYYLSAKSNRRPQVVDKDGYPIDDTEEMYSGVWGYVSLSFFPYAVSGNCGVGCAINNVKKYRDDERFGGGASAASDFAGIDEEEDEDL